MTRPARALLVFLDGVGIGHDDPDRNPFLRARLPTLEALAGGRIPTRSAAEELDLEPVARSDHPATSAVHPRPPVDTGHSFAVDATLGTPGTPQSGTGQAALLTGVDAAAVFGGHFGPWIPVKLRPWVEERSILRAVVDAGGTVAFANAYPKGWPGSRGDRRIAGPPLAARGAGALNRHEHELARGEAIASEIVNEGWRTHLGHTSVPEIRPQHAGRNLAALSSRYDFTLYAHYATDTAGHAKDMGTAIDALERVDAFLEGLLDSLDHRTLLVVASDHGNIEDVGAGHTRNPALGLASGPGASEAARLRDLRNIAPFLQGILAM
jgi:hypothetical protein